jgi:hypothetical protein
MIMPTKAQNVDKMNGAQDGGFNMGINLGKGMGAVKPMNYDGFAEDGDLFTKKPKSRGNPTD